MKTFRNVLIATAIAGAAFTSTYLVTEITDPTPVPVVVDLDRAVRPTVDVELYVDSYYEHMKYVPGTDGWSHTSMDEFAIDVCTAIETWPGEVPAVDVVFALVDQWDWEVDHAGVAVNAAVMANCPEHGPIPATRITR